MNRPENGEKIKRRRKTDNLNTSAIISIQMESNVDIQLYQICLKMIIFVDLEVTPLINIATIPIEIIIVKNT
jgi:hypothetical protein